jgi:hypothetical protein
LKISQLAEKLNYEIVTETYDDKDVKNGYTSDLLSDVMGNAEEESLLITIQAHKNSVVVAMQLDFVAVLICNKRSVPDDMKKAAEEHGIAILRTSDNQFVSSYNVYKEIFGK